MTKENAHLFLPFVQAMAEGKTIQYMYKNLGDILWNDFYDEDQISFGGAIENYRIKPEPRTFELWINKDSGSIRSHQPTDKPEWERITVQEVLE